LRPLDLDEVLVVAEFRAALRRFLRSSELVAPTCGLTPQRYLLLLMIKGAPDRSERATVTELSQRLHLAQNTITDIVARSADAGLIEREPSTDDARVTHLRLTAEGERRLARMMSELAGERRALREAIEALDA
jgi:DNA-binding MarR family transcriptional regulator